MAKNEPFKTPGINLSRPAPIGTNGSVQQVNPAVYTDDTGNLVFRDNFVTKQLGVESLSLRDLYTRANGVFMQDGGIWFRDEKVSRPYSLKEIIDSCKKWKENLATGSLWWIGRTAFDHSACANLPRQDDPAGVNKVWSIDRFLSQENKFSNCLSPNPSAVYENLTNGQGKYKWFDVPGVELVIPPIADPYKVTMLLAKLAYSSYNQPEPIMFRLYDWTTQTELTRTSVINGSADKVMNPVSLSYFGRVPYSEGDDCFQEENCGCTEVQCVDGDPTCDTPDTGTIISSKFSQGARLIKVQFQVVNYQTNHWERTFGAEIDDTYLTESTLDAVVFDVNPNAKFAKKHGQEEFRNTDSIAVKFESPLTSTNYSVSLSSNRNINIWYLNKSTTGFTIKSELPFTGLVDWSIVNINPTSGS